MEEDASEDGSEGGASEGASGGASEGASDGASEGASEGADGASDGAWEGASDGAWEGASEGAWEGASEDGSAGGAVKLPSWEEDCEVESLSPSARVVRGKVPRHIIKANAAENVFFMNFCIFIFLLSNFKFVPLFLIFNVYILSNYMSNLSIFA
ncbi:MAG: hypothetical protein RRY40_05615 [Oscillospiraceae bacterium]